MKLFVRLQLLLFFSFVSLNIYSQNKRALLIGISDYGYANTGWANIHGANDVNLLQPTLKNNGFNIIKVCNRDATAKRIRKEFSALISKCKSGDLIYIHF
jgi:hypothetical protein